MLGPVSLGQFFGHKYKANTKSIPICTNKVSVLKFPCLKNLKFPTWEKQMKLPSCPGAAPVATRGLWTWARRRSPAARELIVWESDQPPPLRHLLLHPRIQPQHISAHLSTIRSGNDADKARCQASLAGSKCSNPRNSFEQLRTAWTQLDSSVMLPTPFKSLPKPNVVRTCLNCSAELCHALSNLSVKSPMAMLLGTAESC